MTATADLTHILIFRTNINATEDKLRIKALLDHTPGIEDWSVDMDDIDRVLRVVSHRLSAGQVEALLKNNGYQCRELE